MRECLRRRNWCLAFILSLYVTRGTAQLYFDPATFSLGSRGALSHALESGPRLPHFLVQAAAPPPPTTVAAAPAPSSSETADAALPIAEVASPAAGDELQEPLVDPGALYSPLQESFIARHGIHSRGNAPPPPPPAPDVAAPSTAPVLGQGMASAPTVAPNAAPGANSSVNGSIHSSPTQIKDLLTPAPPAPPIQAPPPPAPVPTKAPPAQAGNGQPKAGGRDGSQGTCEQQGLQGTCNACICCCSAKGSGGFVSYRPQDCECQREVHTSDVWLMLTMSAIFLVPALLVSVWFAGLFPASPYRDSLYT